MSTLTEVEQIPGMVDSVVSDVNKDFDSFPIFLLCYQQCCHGLPIGYNNRKHHTSCSQLQATVLTSIWLVQLRSCVQLGPIRVNRKLSCSDWLKLTKTHPQGWEWIEGSVACWITAWTQRPLNAGVQVMPVLLSSYLNSGKLLISLCLSFLISMIEIILYLLHEVVMRLEWINDKCQVLWHHWPSKSVSNYHIALYLNKIGGQLGKTNRAAGIK